MKQSLQRKIYGYYLLAIGTASCIAYLAAVIFDPVKDVYVYDNIYVHTSSVVDIIAPILFLAPLLPLLVAAVGTIFIITKDEDSTLLNLATKLGFFASIPIVAIIFCIDYLNGKEGVGLLFLVPILFLNIAIYCASLVLLIIGLMNVRKWRVLKALVVICVLTIILQTILSYATLPKYSKDIYKRAISSKNYELCNEMREGQYRFDCYVKIAKEIKDPLVCDLIDGKRFRYHKDDCLRSLAGELHMETLCNEIQRDLIKRYCIREANK